MTRRILEIIVCLHISALCSTWEVSCTENFNVVIGAKLLKILKYVGQSKVIQSVAWKRNYNCALPHFGSLQVFTPMQISCLQEERHGDPQWIVEELVGRYNPAKQRKIILLDISTLNLILTKDQIKIQLFNSVTILIQDTPQLLPNIRNLVGNFWSERTFLLTLTNIFQLCHFCQEFTHHHVWENLKISPKMSPLDNKFRKNFHHAALFVRNALTGNATSAELDSLKTFSKNQIKLKLRAFLSTQIQIFLNTSIHFLQNGQEHSFETIYFYTLFRPGFNYQRQQVFSFGERKEIKFLTRRKVRDFDWNWVQGPYDAEVWICFCVTFLITMMLMNLILKFEPSRRNKHDIVHTFLLMLRIVLEQHLEQLPSRKTFFRVAFATWLIFCLVITEAYRGEFMGTFVQQRYLEVPKSVEDLENFYTSGTRFKTDNNGTKLTSNVVVLFQEDPRNLSKHRTILETLERGNIVTNYEDLFQRLYVKGDSLIEDSIVLESILSIESKEKFELSEDIVSTDIFNFIEKNVFTRYISNILQLCVETGFVQSKTKSEVGEMVGQAKRVIKGLLRQIGRGQDAENGGKRIILTFAHCKTFFILMFIFYSGSLVIFVVERRRYCVIEGGEISGNFTDKRGYSRRVYRPHKNFCTRIRLRVMIWYISIFREYPQWADC
ncbi:Glutamate receptor [Folsomia candida]|uniref:Glutamate receptor n=1 Tax=Folsomia candida TaxID=158441 RepID=A0A226E8M9_FOLCA|nr:Glutamate receptor [Folsomia candida]